MGEELLAVGAEANELGDWFGGDGNDPLLAVDDSIVVQGHRRWLLLRRRFFSSVVCPT